MIPITVIAKSRDGSSWTQCEQAPQVLPAMGRTALRHGGILTTPKARVKAGLCLKEARQR